MRVRVACLMAALTLAGCGAHVSTMVQPQLRAAPDPSVTPTASAPATAVPTATPRPTVDRVLAQTCLVARPAWGGVDVSGDGNILAVTPDGDRLTTSGDRSILQLVRQGTPRKVMQVAPPQSVASAVVGEGYAAIKVSHGQALNSAWTWYVWPLGAETAPVAVATSVGDGVTTTDPGLFVKPVVALGSMWWNRLVDARYVVSRYELPTGKLTDVVTDGVVEGVVAYQGKVYARRGLVGQPEAARFVDLAAIGENTELAPDTRSLRWLASEGEWLVGADGTTMRWHGPGFSGGGPIAAPISVNDNISASDGYAVISSNMAFPYLVDLRTGAIAPILEQGHYGTATARHGWLLVRDGSGRNPTQMRQIKLADIPALGRC